MSTQPFTPAMGRFAPTRFYDPVVALTRERLWRALAAMYAAPQPGHVIADVGCGTGSLALLLSRVEPRARLVALDPDPEVLAVARRKAAATAAAAAAQWCVGMGDARVESLGANSVDTAVSSLVLHQCPVTKRVVLASMYAVLRPGGKVVIADYGLQRTTLMRLSFRIVQLADGKEDTQPSADGVIPKLMSEVGFREVREAEMMHAADRFHGHGDDREQKALLSAFELMLSSESLTAGTTIAELGHRLELGEAVRQGVFAVVLCALAALLLKPFIDAAAPMREALTALELVDDAELLEFNYIGFIFSTALFDEVASESYLDRVARVAREKGSLKALDTMLNGAGDIAVQFRC